MSIQSSDHAMSSRPTYLIILLWFLRPWAAVAGDPVSDSLWHNIRALPDDSAKVETIIRDVQWLRSQVKNSLEEEALLREGIRVAEKVSYLHGIVECYNLLGVYKRENADYKSAVELHEVALRMASNLRDSVLMAYALNSIGVAYRRLDENQKAFEYHFKALNVAEAAHDKRNITIALNSIGNIQLSLNNYKEAIKEFERCLNIEKDADNDLGIAINYANLGAAYEGLGQLDKAIGLYRQSLNYNTKIESYTGIAICCNLLGKAYLKQDKYSLALQFLQRALSIHDKVNDKINVAENYITIGQIYLTIHRADSAFAAMQRGLDIATRINSRSMMIEAYEALADAHKQEGHFEAAYDAMANAYHYRDSLFTQQASPQMARLRALYELNEKDNQIKLLQQANQIKQLKLNRNGIVAIAAAAILLLALVAGLLYVRQRNMRTHRQTLEYELRLLRSRMNPHFIFNSLNSIHNYIWTNRQTEASGFLTKFSRLMRITLENTKNKSVILTNELEFLHLYLDLEELRCDGKFKYILQVDPSIDPDEILIPSMIIQPFVENAIWHGLVHKPDGDGCLRLQFGLKDGILVCVIEDNGIGRDKAREIKERKTPTHHSVGMEVTEERIRLMREMTGNKATRIHIEDLKDEYGKARGTKVTIQLTAEYVF